MNSIDNLANAFGNSLAQFCTNYLIEKTHTLYLP